MFISSPEHLTAAFKKFILIKATKVIQSRAVSDFLFFFYCLIHIAVGTVYYAAFTLIHRSKIRMRFLYLLFTFTDIIDCVYVNFVC